MQDDFLSRIKELFKSLIYLIYSSIKFKYFFIYMNHTLKI